jgi:beta-glucanase (GH16 family)
VASLKRAASLVLFFATALPAQTALKAPEWVPTFSDEFSQKELEFPKWSVNDPWGHARNRESQAWVPTAVQLQEGNARIAARREPARYDGQQREYTSGILTTYGSFAQMYGRFEIRCRIPAGNGFETKFWLLPIPSGDIPSIDILQVIGSEPSRPHFANRWGDEKTERSYTGTWNSPDLSKDFHVFAIEWDKDKIVWFVDGRERFRSVDGVPHQPMYLVASLAVGGTDAKWPDSSTPFPVFFDIDYVRVFQRP